jgi:hypothetical protein
VEQAHAEPQEPRERRRAAVPDVRVDHTGAGVYFFARFNRRTFAQRRFVAAMIRARPSADSTRRFRDGATSWLPRSWSRISSILLLISARCASYPSRGRDFQ